MQLFNGAKAQRKSPSNDILWLETGHKFKVDQDLINLQRVTPHLVGLISGIQETLWNSKLRIQRFPKKQK
jgi:hypothetical protein